MIDGSEVGWAVALDVIANPTNKVDVLYVIDDSRSNTHTHPSDVIHQGDELMRTLTRELGEPPDLHVGVITSDVGVGDAQVAGCTATGRNGTLQNTPQISGCSAPAGRFLVDRVDPMTGEHVTNYSGSFAEAVACIADVPRTGCGFEQPLEAIRRALDGSNPDNAGFLRDDALLAVIIIADEDDCSARDSRLFAPPSGSDDPLGAQTSFRCFEQGVVCDPDRPRELGQHYNCKPREDSPYVRSVSEYVAFLRGLERESYVHLVSAANPYAEVVLDEEGEPALRPCCGPSETFDYPTAYPAWRLHAFERALGGRSESTGLCQHFSTDEDNMWPTLAIAARIGRVAAGSRCLMGHLWDSDPVASGTQPICRAFDVTRTADGGEERTPIPACPNAGGSCFQLRSSKACETDRDYALVANVQRAQPPPPSSRLVVECLHDDWAVTQ